MAAKYGRDRVAQIATFGTIKARQAIRDAARVMDVPYSQADRIAKLVPEVLNITLEACLADAKGDLRKAYDSEDLVRQVIDMAKPLEGLIRQDSIHAAGVVISKGPLTDHLPLMQKGDAEVVTQVSMTDVEKLGLLKMDFLGLRNLDVIDSAVKIIRAGGQPDFDIETIPLDDALTYRMLAKGDSEGVFQFESSGMRDALREIQPTQLDDLIALVALYRPGPMEFIPQYARNKRDPAGIKFEDDRARAHPEPHLRGRHLPRAADGDLQGHRRLHARPGRRPAQGHRQEDQAQAGAAGAQVPRRRGGHRAPRPGPSTTSGRSWRRPATTRSTSRTPPATRSSPTAPPTSRPTIRCSTWPPSSPASWTPRTRCPFYVTVANEMGIEVLPPDINESVLDFRGVEDRIRFGLNAVKNVGETAIRNILDARERGGPFTGLFDFCERVDLGIVNQRAVESLVKSGAMDSIGPSRRGMLLVLPQAMAHGKKMRADADKGQGSIFDLFSDPEPAAPPARTAAGTATGRAATARPPVDIPTDDFSKEELLALEKETLGLYVSSHPLKDIRHEIRREAGHLISQLGELPDGTVTTIVGMIGTVKRITTKRSGEMMAFVTVEGLEGQVEMLCFPAIYQEHKELLVEDKVVKIKGRVDHKDEAEIKFIPMAIEAFAPKTGLEPVALSVDGDCLPYTVIDDLKRILVRFPGKCSVEMHVRHGDTSRRLRFGDGFRVDPQTSLFAELKALLGEACVCQGAPRERRRQVAGPLRTARGNGDGW